MNIFQLSLSHSNDDLSPGGNESPDNKITTFGKVQTYRYILKTNKIVEFY